MTTISWNEAAPAITDKVGIFPAQGPSIWTAISNGLATGLYWDGSGGASAASGGELKLGTSRAYYDVASKSSTPTSQSTGRLFLCSDTSRLYMYDSAGTYLAGTPFYEEYMTVPAVGAGIIMQAGSTAIGSGVTVTYPLAFTVAPKMVMLTVTDTLGINPPFAVNLTNSFTTGFTSSFSQLNGAPTGGTVYWSAIGQCAGYL